VSGLCVAGLVVPDISPRVCIVSQPNPVHALLSCFLKAHFNLALCTHSSNAWSFSLRLHTRTMLVFLVLIRATYSACLILFGFIE